MSDTTPAPAPAPEPAATPAPAPAPEPTPAATPAAEAPKPQGEAEGIIAEYYKAQLEAANADLESMRERAEKLEREAQERAEAALEAARARALTDHPELADKRIAGRITGTTEDEIMADAKALAEWLAEYTANAIKAATKKTDSRHPAPKLTPARGGEAREPLDTTAIARAARRR